ncbi:unnamed protein product [Malus baccata var. baccata]
MKMKQIEQGNLLSPPPPPPPLPRFWDKKAVPESVTKQEIARFWCQKHINERSISSPLSRLQHVFEPSSSRWTKCNYAYLNQPAIESSVDPPKRRTSTFVPNCFPYTPAPLYRTSVGVL